MNFATGIIIVITVQAVVSIRQQYIRQLTGVSPPPHGVLFRNVNRRLADRSMSFCIKYLCNYGFYKFGVEVSNIQVIFINYSILNARKIVVFLNISWKINVTG